MPFWSVMLDGGRLVELRAETVREARIGAYNAVLREDGCCTGTLRRNGQPFEEIDVEGYRFPVREDGLTVDYHPILDDELIMGPTEAGNGFVVNADLFEFDNIPIACYERDEATEPYDMEHPIGMWAVPGIDGETGGTSWEFVKERDERAVFPVWFFPAKEGSE